MTSDMQEIAITEDKPLLTGQADPAKVRKAAICSLKHMCTLIIDVLFFYINSANIKISADFMHSKNTGTYSGNISHRQQL